MAKDLLLSEMLKRAAIKHSDALVRTPKPQRVSKGPTLSPRMSLILGSLADSASTAAFLSQGRQEANPALQVFNRHPWTVAPIAAGGAAGYAILHKLLSKKAPKLADTVAGGLGAFHAALAGANFDSNHEENSYQAVARKMLTRKK